MGELLDRKLNPGDLNRLYEVFKERAESMGAEVHRSAPGELPGKIAAVLRETGASVIGVHETSLVREAALVAGLRREGFDVRDRVVTRREAVDLDAGLTEMDLAMAETGTLCQDATDLTVRLLSTLTPLHVALVRSSSLVASYEDVFSFWTRINPGGLPTYVAFVTGPSRTADIERVLTIGVHGPGRLVIFFVDGGER